MFSKYGSCTRVQAEMGGPFPSRSADNLSNRGIANDTTEIDVGHKSLDTMQIPLGAPDKGPACAILKPLLPSFIQLQNAITK